MVEVVKPNFEKYSLTQLSSFTIKKTETREVNDPSSI